MVCRSFHSCTVVLSLKRNFHSFLSLLDRTPSISQHVFPIPINHWESEHHMWCNRHHFSLKQHIPPPGELLSAEVSLSITGIIASRDMLLCVPAWEKRLALGCFRSVMAAFSRRLSFRAGEVIPRHPVLFSFQGARVAFCPSPCIAHFFSFLTKNNQKKFFSLLSTFRFR